MKKAVFLDRDGTLIEDRHYLSKPEEVVLLPGTLEGLVALQQAGYALVLVTNQSGIGRGYFTLEDYEKVQAHLMNLFAQQGIHFTASYMSPEAPDQPSQGRKPSPFFLFQARDAFGIDLSQSFMVGDKMIDLECGWNAGVKKSFLVRTGYGQKVEKENPPALAKALVEDNLLGVSRQILALENKSASLSV